jgi:hypothetical protein
MKICLVLIIAASMAAQKTPTPSAAPAETNQKRARAVLDQMVQALGGDNYLKIQDCRFEGWVGRFYQGRSEGATLYLRMWQWPDKERTEWTKARDVVQVVRGDAVYEITFRGVRPVDISKDYQARIRSEERHHALEIIVRKWMSNPAIALFDEEPSLAENHKVERITIIDGKNDAVTLLIDLETHLPVKKTFVIRDERGIRDEIGEIYDNWKVVQGVNTPFNTLITRNGEVQRQYFLSSAAYNTGLADSLFVPSLLAEGEKAR